MNRALRILVVDDEEAMRESLAGWLMADGYAVATAAGGAQALESLAADPRDLVLADIKMPGMDGLTLLERLRAEHPATMVIMITAYGAINTAVQAMKAGAADYLLKPFDPEEMMLTVARLEKHRALELENVSLKEQLAERVVFEDLIAQSPDMLKLFDLVAEVAPSEAAVLITGETGTGKELVARAVHARSQRGFGPFVAINCGAMAESLLESELFGHERGAFTGAVKARRGRLEMADGGTLFLDEVGEIPPRMQVDLLRVLEERRFFRVGGSTPVASDFRLICATHRDLPALVESGDFRRDFYYRINVIALSVPPLRERPGDVELLAEHFRARFCRETGKRLAGLSREATRLLKAYAWPGNVRELKNVMERAVVLARGARIEAGDLTFPAGRGEEPAGTLAEVEVSHIRRVLAAQEWNVTAAAKVLGIDRVTLTRKMKRLGLTRPA
jgi:two-component system response regulator HydG